MGHSRTLREYWLFGLILGLILPFTACAAGPDDSRGTAEPETTDGYRFPRTPGTTEAGYPLPLSGIPITKTPVVAEEGVSVKEYPEHYIPGQESLAENEMRITVCGSGIPAPLRIGQGTSCLLVELGNGETFIFDVGGGTVGNLFALGVHPADLDKLFLTHLHLDHAGGIFPLFDAMGWARNTPLHVWGASGYTPDLGVAAFTENVRKAAEWHVQSKQHVLPSGGTQIIPHEFDYAAFSPEQPRQLVYDENGVRIYAFPVIHTLSGAVGYRLEWNGLALAYTADSQPSTFEAEQARSVDVFIHEIMASAEEFADRNHMPIEHARNVMAEHTQPGELGRVLEIARPRLGVGMHFGLDDALIDPLFERWRTTYDGPVVLVQDLTTMNVTPAQIVIRQTKADLLAWAPPPAGNGGDPKVSPPSEAKRPSWLTETRIRQEP